MVSYNTYPILLPEAPPPPLMGLSGSEAIGTHSAENPQIPYHLNMVQDKRRGLINKEVMFKEKYKKYNRILNRLTWLHASSSGISVATGISSVSTFATFIGIPVSAALGAAFMTGTIASGIISVLTKKYQQKLKKVTHLINIITPALVAFERVVSGALKNGIIDEEEFNMFQTLHLETLNKLTGINHRMEVEHRSLVEKSLLEEINKLKKAQGTRV